MPLGLLWEAPPLSRFLPRHRIVPPAGEVLPRL